MKYLKLFEGFNKGIEEELADELNQDTIEDYYDKNSSDDAEELISLYPSLIWNNIDDNRYVDDWIDNDINNQSMEDLAYKNDLKEFLENNWNDEKEDKVVELWKETQGDDLKYNDKVSKIEGMVSIIEVKNSNDHIIKITSSDGKIKKYKIPEDHVILVEDGQHVNKGEDLSTLAYEEYMLDDLDEDELKEIIKFFNEEDDYVEFAVTKRYEGYDAKELIEEIYGDVTKMESKDLYNIVEFYIDDEAIEKEYRDNMDFETKKEFIQNKIKDNVFLQREILKNNSNNVLKLAQLYEEEKCDEDMSDEYEFQKLYIEEYVKDNIDEDYFDEEEKNTLIAKALKYLNDNFDLDETIEKEYDAWRWMIDADKYNL